MREEGPRRDSSRPSTVASLTPIALTALRQWLTLLAVRIEWDEAKERANRDKHGLSFAEAQELFCSGTDYLEIYDRDHSDTEERFIAVGPIARGLAMIVWSERDDGAVRIISARWATAKERELYLHYMEQNR